MTTVIEVLCVAGFSFITVAAFLGFFALMNWGADKLYDFVNERRCINLLTLIRGNFSVFQGDLVHRDRLGSSPNS